MVVLPTFLFLKKVGGGKLEATNFRAVVLGYDDESKAYRLYDPKLRKVIISHQVHILEQQLGNFGTHKLPFIDIFAPLFDASGEIQEPPEPKFAPPDLNQIPLPADLADEPPLNAPHLDVAVGPILPAAAPPPNLIPEQPPVIRRALPYTRASSTSTGSRLLSY